MPCRSKSASDFLSIVKLPSETPNVLRRASSSPRCAKAHVSLASDRTYGARRVWHDMLAEGMSCGLHRIERLMRRQPAAHPGRARRAGSMWLRSSICSRGVWSAGR